MKMEDIHKSEYNVIKNSIQQSKKFNLTESSRHHFLLRLVPRISRKCEGVCKWIVVVSRKNWLQNIAVSSSIDLMTLGICEVLSLCQRVSGLAKCDILEYLNFVSSLIFLAETHICLPYILTLGASWKNIECYLSF